MKTTIFVLLAWMVATGAVAAEETVQLLPSPLVFPKRIGPMALGGEPHDGTDSSLKRVRAAYIEELGCK